MKIRTALAALILAVCAISASAQDGARHGLSAFGDLKYPAGFRHFDYVNPAAPKGGEVRNWELDTFDNLHPLVLKGVPAAGLDRSRGPDWLFESLMQRALDEPDAMYGRLAESVELGPERAWAAFNLNPNARWHDGLPVTADDVVFTFESVMKDGDPRRRLLYQDVAGVRAEGPRRVVFSFKPGESRRDMPLLVADMPVMSRAWFATRDFSRQQAEQPLASGPYRVERIVQGRSIVYRRVENWWGRDLPVNVGRYNFDTIRHEYFRDRDIAAEAFFTHEYDFRVDVTARHWAQMYDDKQPFKQGFIRKDELRDGTPSGVQGWFLNTRREKFADVRVREALNLAYDFEWANKTLFFGLYQRTRSMFANSNLEATGLPTPAEVALLEPFRDKLPPRLFAQDFQNPVTDGAGNPRDNLRRAQALLAGAGWTTKNGKLTNAKGEPFVMEFLMFEKSFDRIIEPYIRNLERLGISASMRIVDLSTWENRVRAHDFDIITRRYAMNQTPGVEMRTFWGSAAADTQGSYNVAGVKNPVVDALVEKIIAATDRQTLVAASHALDRVLMWNFYVVPHWYSGKIRLATWDRFGRPPQQPAYQGSDSLIELMWFDAEKNRRLPARS
jgi:microcin C transport system substrate-binding protein